MSRYRLTALAIALILSLFVPAAEADWFDDYEDGLKAAERGSWNEVVSKMSAALKAKSAEGRHRSYGTIFVEYYPYYYRGMAHFELGNWEQAVSDLQKTKGTGRVKLGSADSKIAQAQRKIDEARQPAPQPAPVQQQPPPQSQPQPPVQQPAPTQPAPAQPRVDPALAPAKSSAERALAAAQKKMSDAQRQQAPAHASTQYNQAVQSLVAAQTAAASADSTAEWRNVESTAERASRLFDSAVTLARAETARQSNVPSRAAEDVLAATRTRVRDAVELYFAGEFAQAASAFEVLSRDQEDNPMIWQFLGASRYYAFLLDGKNDQAQLESAREAFRQAKKLNPKLSLNPKYFSPRIRAVYDAL